MDNNEDRTYSPGKTTQAGSLISGDTVARYHSVGQAAPLLLPPETVLPYHMANYSLSGVPTYSAANVAHSMSTLQSAAIGSLHMPAVPSSAVHLAAPLPPVQTAQPPSASGLHLPSAAAVGVLHGAVVSSNALQNQMVAAANVLHPQSSVGPFHIQTAPMSAHSASVLPHPTQPSQMWAHGAGGQNLPDVVQGNQQQQNFQRLKVEDALSYLDQVKFQFSGQPQVYNDFLDIMKEFKSQSIDTPGVITRVSNLFRGHPDLIVGFNTFLPPGYKIEVQGNETISVLQPGQQAITLAALQSAPQQVQPVIKPAHFNSSNLTGTRPEPARSSQSTPGAPGLSIVASAGTSSSIGSTLAAAGANNSSGSGGQPVEFNHAIQYVNKIKQCYQNQPEIYKSFLDILHLYQKEQKMLKEGSGFSPGYRPLSESEVYDKVVELFRDQPQLLAEFSQFLPDAGSGATMSNMSFGMAVEASVSQPSRARVDQPSAAKSATVPVAAASKSLRPTPLTRRTAPAGGGYQPPAKKLKSGYKDLLDADVHASSGDMGFLDKLKLELRDKPGNDDIIRYIDLYMRRAVSGSNLVHAVKNPDVRSRLIEYLTHIDADFRTEFDYDSAVPPFDSASNSGAISKSAYHVDLSTCKQEGVSYRKLPKSYMQPTCSGRTELCNEVLNDTYALYPTWPEDVTSTATKKTQYEEYMYQCEDERYELDMVIDVNHMAINVLNNLSSRFKSTTSSDEIARLRLDDKLGSNSTVLVQTAIKRLYGDNAQNIIDGLKCSPSVAVPIVLRRLLAKEKEWRSAQHEFNRYWREQTDRYYLKSLDLQATKFKQNEMKLLRSKSFVKELEVLAEEAKASAAGDKQDAKPLPYATLNLHKRAISGDAAQLVEHYNQCTASLQAEDKTRSQQILRNVLSVLLQFDLPPVGFQSSENSDSKDSSDGSSSRKDSSGSRRDKENGKGNSSNQPAAKGDSTSSKLSWVKVEPVPQDNANTAASKPNVLFYGNEQWYLCVRLFMLLCERLQYFRRLASELTAEEDSFRPLRSELMQQAVSLRCPYTIELAESYSFLLEMVRGLLDGSVDWNSYEEQLRDVFDGHAHVAFTMDKLIQNISRQLQLIVTRDVCQQLVDLFETRGSMSAAEYQRKVEEAVGEENYFKLELNADQNQITMQLIENTASSSSSDENIDRSPEFADDTAVSTQKPTFLARNVRKALNSKQRQEALGGTTGTHQLTWMTTEGSSEVIKPTELQLINTTSSGGVVKYTCGALTRAKETQASVCRRMYTKFNRWLTRHWQTVHVTTSMTDSFNNWLLGSVDGLQEGLVTVSREVAALHQPPFHAYYKYNVMHANDVTDASAAVKSDSI